MAKRIVGVGAANVDMHGTSRSSIIMRDSNPAHFITSVGGVTRNILDNLAHQGLDTALLSAVGDDVFGQKILSDSTAVGIDMRHVRIKPGATSSCYIALLDDNGDMFVAMSDMTIIEDLENSYLDEKQDLLRSANTIVCDGCLPRHLMEHLVTEIAGTVPVFIDPVSTAYAKNMEPFTGYFYGIKPNKMELSILSGMHVETDLDIERAVERVLNRGTKCVAVSLGARGCYYADAAGKRLFRALRPLTHMVDATGAGDAFMAGFVHGFVEKMPLTEQLDYALASGLIAIQSEKTIHPDMCDALVRETILDYQP